MSSPLRDLWLPVLARGTFGSLGWPIECRDVSTVFL